MGAVPMAGSPNEKITQGLDGLRERLKEYHGMGARFAKWRAVITIGDGIPTLGNLQENARALANYAALCQEQGIVPIVEPEVLMDADNTIERCMSVTTQTLHEVFDSLYDHCVVLEEMLLKPNMVIAGKLCKKQASVDEVASMTLECFRRTVPAAVPGIVFLSGGQSSSQATANLNAMNARGPHPWQLSFSYGRALQDEALKAWKGQDKNVAAGQKAFFNRAKMNGAARDGQYSEKMEKELAAV
jgi:fructose-bisphosphate aldolase class I